MAVVLRTLCWSTSEEAPRRKRLLFRPCSFGARKLIREFPLAAGIQARTQEVWQTLDLRYPLNAKGNHVTECAFWGPNGYGELERTHVAKECVHPTPYPYILAVAQKEVEEVFDSDLNSRGHYVDRPTQLLHFEYTNDTEYPIHARVRHKFRNTTSVYRCKYLIGSDGAASTTRRLLGVQSDSESTEDDVWLVGDMELETDFPDHRRRSQIRSPAGAILLIPHAGWNRIYTQLTPEEITRLQGIDESKLGMTTQWKDAEMLNIFQTRVKEALGKYTGDIKRVQWMSQYRIKQRLTKDFYDGNRVFVMGDACHTHSPKAAQGLNVSMMDAYNLTWKLALVLQGNAQPLVLETYNTERKQIAEELIDFDVKYSHIFSKKEYLDGNAEVHALYDKAHGFTTGVGIHYQDNPLVDHSSTVSINRNSLEPLTPGKRLHALTAIRHIDGSTTDILDDLPSNGRFHLFIFAGNALSQDRLQQCAVYLNSADSILTRYSSGFAKPWAFEDIRHTKPENKGRVIDLFLIHTDNHHDFNLARLPAPFPNWQYRVYSDKNGKEHEDHGVDPSTGAMALVRPDGYISMVTGLDGGPAITKLMDNFMINPQPVHQKPNGYVNGNGEAHGMKHVRIKGSCNGIANGDRTSPTRPEMKVASEWLYGGVDVRMPVF